MVDAGIAGSGAGTGLGMEAVWVAPVGAFSPRRHDRDRRALDARRSRIDRWGVGLVVVVLHVLLAVPLQRLLFGRATLAGLEPAMQLVYVAWLPRAQEPPPAPASTPGASVRTRAERPRPAEEAAVADRPAPADAPLALSLAADDRWTTDAGRHAAPTSAVQSFRRRNPVQPPPPERFRMVDRSPAAIVRRVAMGLFWPPGYSDDPCAGINEAIDAFSQRTKSERDHRLLADAMLHRSRYCPP